MIPANGCMFPCNPAQSQCRQQAVTGQVTGRSRTGDPSCHSPSGVKPGNGRTIASKHAGIAIDTNSALGVEEGCPNLHPAVGRTQGPGNITAAKLILLTPRHFGILVQSLTQLSSIDLQHSCQFFDAVGFANSSRFHQGRKVGKASQSQPKPDK